jgi:CheY-like chemotaxis protein
LLSDDLIFTSRISGTAHELGYTLLVARSPSALLELVRDNSPGCIILDLSNPGLSIADLVRQARPAGAALPFIVAYGSHVDTATLRAAREAGCDLVLPRSKFVEELPSALPRWFAAGEKEAKRP